MALKHFKGSVPTAAGVEWTCPSCQAKQQGRLELGCTACGAGKPADVPQAAAQSITDPLDVEGAYQQYLAVVDDGLTGGGWSTNSLRELVKHAWMAGYRMGLTREQTAPAGTAPTVASVGGTVRPEAVPPQHYTLALLTEEGAVDPIGPVTEATLLAALAFYRDNQLVYGAVPGQLTADQLTELITQLSPIADEVPV